MTDNTTPATNTDGHVHADLQTLLGVCLPGLSDEDLRDLSARVADELELRVGNELSRGLSDAQLQEFEDLADRDGDLVFGWLQSVCPDYRVVVAEARADLVAETVRAVASANPAAAEGRRVFSPMLDPSLGLVEEHLGSQGVKYTRDDRELRVAFAADDGTPATVIRIELVGRDQDILTLTGMAREADFPAGERERVLTFASDWNRRTWIPKAVVIGDQDSGRCLLTGEVAVYTGREVTRSQIRAAVDRAITSVLGFYAETRQKLLAPVMPQSDSDARCTPTDGTPPSDMTGVR